MGNPRKERERLESVERNHPGGVDLRAHTESSSISKSDWFINDVNNCIIHMIIFFCLASNSVRFRVRLSSGLLLSPTREI